MGSLGHHSQESGTTDSELPWGSGTTSSLGEATASSDDALGDSEAVTTSQPLRTSVPRALDLRDPMQKTSEFMGLFLFDLLADFRVRCEKEGRAIVFVTTDTRSDYAVDEERKIMNQVASVEKKPTVQYASDTFVRSFIGIAGRFNAHARYRAESKPKLGSSNQISRIVNVKDEIHGRTGRAIFLSLHARQSYLLDPRRDSPLRFEPPSVLWDCNKTR